MPNQPFNQSIKYDTFDPESVKSHKSIDLQFADFLGIPDGK